MFRSRAFNGLLLIACLVFAGYLLRASLPRDFRRPSQIGRVPERIDDPVPASLQGQPIDPKTWRHATPDERQKAIGSIRGQLLAFRRDDYERAFFYQGRALRGPYNSPSSLRTMITRLYPEFGYVTSVTFGNSWADPKGQHLDIPVTLTGGNGIRSRALYLMDREGDIYHVGGVTNIVRAAVQGRR